jgi:hypothetical protein
MAIDPYANCNSTITDTNQCTLSTCCLAQSPFLYRPDFAGNQFFVIHFAIGLFFQLGLGIRHKTWGYMTAMICGLLLEIVGYVARLQLHANPFDSNAFLM